MTIILQLTTVEGIPSSVNGREFSNGLQQDMELEIEIFSKLTPTTTEHR